MHIYVLGVYVYIPHIYMYVYYIYVPRTHKCIYTIYTHICTLTYTCHSQPLTSVHYGGWKS